MNTTAIPRPTRIASVGNLVQAWRDSKDASGKGRAAGIDRVTATSFRENLNRNIELLHDRLVSGSFHFQRLRPICIQKPNGKIRIICVPTVEDRLVQRLIASYLAANDKLEIGNDVSYGTMRGRGGTRAAIKSARNLRRDFPWVFKSDISQFFDQIPRGRLKTSLEKKLKRSSIVPLLHAAIDCEIDARGARNAADVRNAGIREGLGLRQGMPLSPMLYLTMC
jgi:RNA-directed DNA polymerase